MIKPSIGRVLWFYDENHSEGDQPKTALVCHVWSDTCVNLAVFDTNGNPTPGRTSVLLHQGEGERPARMFAEWMPYQIGQAAKHEKDEAK